MSSNNPNVYVFEMNAHVSTPVRVICPTSMKVPRCCIWSGWRKTGHQKNWIQIALIQSQILPQISAFHHSGTNPFVIKKQKNLELTFFHGMNPQNELQLVFCLKTDPFMY